MTSSNILHANDVIWLDMQIRLKGKNIYANHQKQVLSMIVM